jgi:hypothetical protein
MAASRWPAAILQADGPLSPDRTELLEAAIARGWPLDGMCPHPACQRVDAVTNHWNGIGDVLVFEFHPCGHRYFPQWRTPERHPSRFLNHPVSRRRPRWWHRS